MQAALLLGVNGAWTALLGGALLGGLVVFCVVVIINRSKQATLKQAVDVILEEASRLDRIVTRHATSSPPSAARWVA